MSVAQEEFYGAPVTDLDIRASLQRELGEIQAECHLAEVAFMSAIALRAEHDLPQAPLPFPEFKPSIDPQALSKLKAKQYEIIADMLAVDIRLRMRGQDHREVLSELRTPELSMDQPELAQICTAPGTLQATFQAARQLGLVTVEGSLVPEEA